MKKKIPPIKLADFLKGNSDDNTSSDKEKSPFKLTRKYVLALLGLGICWMIASSLFANTNQKTNSMLSPISTETSGSPKNNEQAVETLGSGGGKSSSNKIEEIEKKYEQQLTETLNNMAGVSNVKVEINLESSGRKVYQTNKTNRTQETNETDKQGGTRNIDDQSQEEQVVIIDNGDKQEPVIVETEMPRIRGVLIVAKGAQNLEIKQMIREAVTRLLDVPSYRVSVQPKK
ncbi:stage III sporulation protein AG [Bacillus sp. AFS055030]|uniref:stage III sporulation protein AG n=1 Tax=Bacillus sp. AFS055030 TaxID=2033507 RepID=UPI000BFC98CC|nr:stage III sporulation protein AG [Bacillus sp. AFS055030]PGL72408.1 stage III sporulation protein AG [Bacillus sp. AFS055030]